MAISRTSFKKGYIPWNVKHNVNLICNHCKKVFNVQKYRKTTAKYCSRECKDKSLIGNPSWNKGTKGICKPNYGSFKKGITPWLKEKKHREERIRKMISKLKFRPTPYEKRLKEILDRLQPNEWRYTGDGSFWMGFPPLNPDFVNCNGKKIAIEVFAKYHKEKNYGSVENYILQRSKGFSKYGWKTIFILGEEELDNPKEILRKIQAEVSNMGGGCH